MNERHINRMCVMHPRISKVLKLNFIHDTWLLKYALNLTCLLNRLEWSVSEFRVKKLLPMMVVRFN